MATYAFVLIVGLAAGAVSGIIVTGATIIPLPVLVLQFGPKQAVPIMAIAGLMSNVAGGGPLTTRAGASPVGYHQIADMI